jgi:hypothetical protein
VKLLSRLSSTQRAEERMSWNEYLGWINQVYGTDWGGVGTVPQTYTPGSNKESVATDFGSNVSSIFKRNGPIFALMSFRLALFAQVRWNYQRFNQGRPGDLWSDQSLDVLNDDPYLAARMIQDVDLAGNFYGYRDGDRIWRLRPDWVQALSDKPLDHHDAEIKAYAFYPGGMGVAKDEDVRVFLADEVVHWWPIPDPEACWRGMSWLTPIAREVASDNAATGHKLKFFENGATPNLVFKFDERTSPAAVKEFKEMIDTDNTGAHNAYKPLFMGGGADVTVVGADLKQLEFSVTQGKGESRLASAARVPAVLVGFSEGMQAATYSNFGQARRGAADTLLYPLWTSAASALGQVVQPPADSRLWYDARDIPFLREDAKDDAEIKAQDASTMRQLVDGGFEPDTVVDAVLSGDWTRLVHSGKLSVQLQEPGAQLEPKKVDPPVD